MSGADHAVRFPDTALVIEARDRVGAALPRQLLHHSLRVYLLGRAFGHARRIDFDEEGLCLAALFHDLGLVPELLQDGPFAAVGSGELARFAEARGVEAARAQAMADALPDADQLLGVRGVALSALLQARERRGRVPAYAVASVGAPGPPGAASA